MAGVGAAILARQVSAVLVAAVGIGAERAQVVYDEPVAAQAIALLGEPGGLASAQGGASAATRATAREPVGQPISALS